MSVDLKQKHHCVIVGAGFAGLFALQMLCKEARESDNIEVTLIDKNDAFVFIPMIHEVAVGLLQPDSITMSLRLFGNHAIVRNIIQGSATNIDCEKNIVVVDRTEGWTEEISYDTLILATGSTTHFFGITGAQEHALPLRTLDDAKRIKDHIIEMFDRADESKNLDEVKTLLRFVVVGGGATGVEVAAELGDALSRDLPKCFPHLALHGEVVLVNKGSRLLGEADEWFSKRTAQALLKKPGVTMLNNMGVQEVTENGVRTDTGSLSSKTVIWCAGVHGLSVPIHTTTPLVRDEKSHRIAVTPFLYTKEHPNLFVLGDTSLVTDSSTGKPYGMRAQFAVEQGELAAKNILARLRKGTERPFSWRERGFIISLGQFNAIAQIGPVRFSGLLAWIIYHAAYLRTIVGARAKMRTLLEWTLNLVTPRDFSKV